MTQSVEKTTRNDRISISIWPPGNYERDWLSGGQGGYYKIKSSQVVLDSDDQEKMTSYLTFIAV